MTVLSYQSIKRCQPIKNMQERGVHNGRSFGLSSAGYDIRIAEEIYLKPGEFRLASSMEEFQMPNDLIAFVHDKSSWARQGLAVQNTVIEPGWCGFLTLELTNHLKQEAWGSPSNTLTLKPGDPIAQIIFHYLDQATEKPYNGKYQNQESGPQQARFERSI